MFYQMLIAQSKLDSLQQEFNFFLHKAIVLYLSHEIPGKLLYLLEAFEAVWHRQCFLSFVKMFLLHFDLRRLLSSVSG